MHLFRYHFVAQVLLVIVGVGWCWNVMSTFRDDWREFRSSKVADVRTALIVSWAMTLAALLGLAVWTPAVVGEFIRLLR